jgi:hypothetical protein
LQAHRLSETPLETAEWNVFVDLIQSGQLGRL